MLARDERRPYEVLAVGALAAGVFVLSPTNSVIQIGAYFVPLVLAAVLVSHRWRRSSPGTRGVLGGLLAGIWVYLTVTVVWYLTPVVLDTALPFPSAVDLAYFVAYGIYGVFLLMVIRRQKNGHRLEGRLAALDALILTAAATTVVWVAIIVPNLGAGVGGWVLVAVLGYPFFTVVLFALVVRIAVGGEALLNGAGVLLILWVGTEVVADVIYGHQSATGNFAYGTWLSLLWMASYTCLAALAVHPRFEEVLSLPRSDRSAASASERSPVTAWGRLLLLYVAALLPVVLLAGHVSYLVMVLSSAVSIGLVVIRLAVVAGDRLEQRRLASELEQASAAKSVFLATVSHEIRTPLNGIIGLTGLLLNTDLDQRQRQYAQGVHSSGNAMLMIVNDVLDFSKIKAGKVEPETVDFTLVEVVEEVAELFAPETQRKRLELLAYCTPEVPLGVRGDPLRLRQVLLNLVSNAVKFTDDGEVVVRVHVEERTATGGVVLRFEVTDTGIGMSSIDQQGLFDPFSQGDSTTTRRFGGTGLGLAIAHELVTAMGGVLNVESEPGHGSTFWFSLPMGIALSQTLAVPSLAGQLEGVRVLVVDDNETHRLILTEQLMAWGMRPDAVSGGRAALASLARGSEGGDPYLLAVLDLCMPDMDGLELSRAIGADAALAGIGLVLLTSGPDVSVEKTRAAGISTWLSKPVRFSRLHTALVAAQGTTTSRRPSAAPGLSEPPVKHLGHVLVAEDDEINQLVALGILERLGYTTEVAANGLEALAALDRTDFAVVLMDCQMPEMDGYTATRAIRSRGDDTRRTPVIAMTATATEGEREKCLEAGMDDFIAKPVDSQILASTLEQWVVRQPEPIDQGKTDPWQAYAR